MTTHRRAECLWTDDGQLKPLLPAHGANHTSDLEKLVDAIEGKEIDTLLILGGNPAYTAPADVPPTISTSLL